MDSPHWAATAVLAEENALFDQIVAQVVQQDNDGNAKPNNVRACSVSTRP